jgi:hypothetical protein
VRKAVPILVVAVSVLLLLLGFGAFAIYRATHATPEFYERALTRDRDIQKQASQEFLQQASALVSDAQQTDRWQIIFSAEQINGWLAVDVPQNLPTVMPVEMREPRVDIQPGEMTLACRWKSARIDAVVSVSCDIFVSGSNEIAIRFRRATLGALRVPIRQVLEPAGRAAKKLNLQLVWRQQGGDPVAVLRLDDAKSEGEGGLELESIELGSGKLLIVGGKRSSQTVAKAQKERSTARIAASQEAAESATNTTRQH